MSEFGVSSLILEHDSILVSKKCFYYFYENSCNNWLVIENLSLFMPGEQGQKLRREEYIWVQRDKRKNCWRGAIVSVRGRRTA